MKIKLSKEELEIILLALKGKLPEALKEDKPDEKVAMEENH